MDRDQHTSRHAVKDRPGVEFSHEPGNVVRLHFASRPAAAVVRGSAPYHEAAIAEDHPKPSKH